MNELREVFRRKSVDGSFKIGLQTKDYDFLETICMPRKKKTKVCISSQIGCGFACLHCRTGTVGLKRNLTSKEMVMQATIGLSYGIPESTPEIIYFGAGEPFLNFENVVESMYSLFDSVELIENYSQLQVSTSGVKGKILEYGKLKINPRLAVSIHSAIQKKREYLIPQSKNYGLTQLHGELMLYFQEKSQRIIVHYTLISGFNTDRESADSLFEYLKEFNCVVYLIPYNEYEGGIFLRPSLRESKDFLDRLLNKGVKAELRPSRGVDVGGACGQLVCNLEAKKRGSNKF